MPVGYKRLTRGTITLAERDELQRVDDLAAQLVAHLERSETEISAVHVHGAQSGVVQRIVSLLLREELGFDEETRFAEEIGLTTRVRPDFIFHLGPGRGILAEVERGGTTTNNHDLKDFWKTHIAPDAQHLFLIVPRANWSKSGRARERPFERVASRLAAFFGDQRREVDVLSVHVFGYGTVILEPGQTSEAAVTTPPGSAPDTGWRAPARPIPRAPEQLAERPRWSPLQLTPRVHLHATRTVGTDIGASVSWRVQAGAFDPGRPPTSRGTFRIGWVCRRRWMSQW